MKLYVLFGKTGSGKTHIGSFIHQQFGIEHIDGDKYITKDMKACLVSDKQITRTMIDDYVKTLILVVKAKLALCTDKPFVLTQALYMNEHRTKILKEIPGAVMVYIKTSPELRAVRITERYKQKQSTVSLKYAKTMDKFFQEPRHPVIELSNLTSDPNRLREIIVRQLPMLAKIESAKTVETKLVASL